MKLKRPDQVVLEKDKQKREEEKVENVLNEARVPDEQNRLKTTMPTRV